MSSNTGSAKSVVPAAANASAPEPLATRLTPAKIWRFLTLAIGKASSDALVLQSAALAFITLVSLIPLLAIFSQLGASVFLDTDRLVELLAQLLPYSEQAILRQVTEFLQHAKAVTSIGFLTFLVTSLSAFSTIEETLNRIWNVADKRPLRKRLLSFTLVMFWGPLVIGTSYSLLFYLSQQQALRTLEYALPLHLIPSLFTCLGLTMLYWLVPYTAVRFRSAVVGGVVATLLIEALRQVYGAYIELARGISIIYGSFGFAFFFILSIQITWWIVLLGSEIAYALQHFKLLTGTRRQAAALDGSWLGLAAMTVIGRRFLSGEPITPHELLAERLRLRADDLQPVLQPLIERRFLHEASGDGEGYLLSADPYKLTVEDILTAYEPAHQGLPRSGTRETNTRLEDLRRRMRAARLGESRGSTLASLIENDPAAALPAREESSRSTGV